MSKYMDIEMQLATEEQRKQKPADSELVFGKIFTDHLFELSYENENWGTPRIVPYHPFSLDPATSVFHYGQEIFEGMKAFRHPDGSIHLFRPYKNAERFMKSAERMSMPTVNKDLFVKAITELVKLENEWVPNSPGMTLYIRPTMIATEVALGVHPSDKYLFYIILSPVGPYFKTGFKPTKVYVTSTHIRAAPGGTGEAKTGGNYSATLWSQQKAKSLGYPQVLWLDALERKYVEEAGAMNIMFVIDGEIYTPPLDGTILRGITRESVMVLAKDLGYTIHEEPIIITDLIDKIQDGSCSEIFCVGTAASITPLGEIFYKGEEYIVNGGEVGKITQYLYDELVGIQFGKIPDRFNWMHKVI
ncbi:MAG: branched-chain amino acid aminotransferase [Candidatus Heimdallarchaeaceae archaeon]